MNIQEKVIEIRTLEVQASALNLSLKKYIGYKVEDLPSEDLKELFKAREEIIALHDVKVEELQNAGLPIEGEMKVMQMMTKLTLDEAFIIQDLLSHDMTLKELEEFTNENIRKHISKREEKQVFEMLYTLQTNGFRIPALERVLSAFHDSLGDRVMTDAMQEEFNKRMRELVDLYMEVEHTENALADIMYKRNNYIVEWDILNNVKLESKTKLIPMFMDVAEAMCYTIPEFTFEDIADIVREVTGGSV